MSDSFGVELIAQLVKSIDVDKLMECVDWEKVNDEKRKFMDIPVRKTNKYKELSMRLSNQRQTGRTTAICNAARNINAAVVFPHCSITRIMSNKFGIKAIGLGELDRIIVGTREPVLLDHYTVETLLNDAGDEIIRLEKELASIKRMLHFE